jgi:hypothetical protein
LKLTGVNGNQSHVAEGYFSKRPTEYNAKFAAPRPSSEGEAAGLVHERQLSVSLAVQTEQDYRIAQLTDELEANAAETAKHADRPLVQTASLCFTSDATPTSLVKQRDAELMDMQAKLGKSLQSRDQEIGQCEKELADIRGKLEVKKSELEAARSRLTETPRSKPRRIGPVPRVKLRQTRALWASDSINTDEDQVTPGFIERV